MVDKRKTCMSNGQTVFVLFLRSGNITVDQSLYKPTIIIATNYRIRL